MSYQQMTEQQQYEEEMESHALICKAMAQAFPKIEGAVKGSTNPHFRSRYADLSAVVDAIKPALAQHGLWFTQITKPHDHGIVVDTVLFHESGEFLSLGSLYMPASKQDAQGFGSCLTYARRYSLMAAFGVPAEDDDGNAAVKAVPRETTRDVSPARAKVVRAVADECIKKHAAGDEWGCYEERSTLTDSEEVLLLWDFLAPHSKVRSSIKHYADLEKQQQARVPA
jgi:hypothetical protein